MAEVPLFKHLACVVQLWLFEALVATVLSRLRAMKNTGPLINNGISKSVPSPAVQLDHSEDLLQSPLFSRNIFGSVSVATQLDHSMAASTPVVAESHEK